MSSALADIESLLLPGGPVRPEQSFQVGKGKESHIYERAQMVA